MVDVHPHCYLVFGPSSHYYSTTGRIMLSKLVLIEIMKLKGYVHLAWLIVLSFHILDLSILVKTMTVDKEIINYIPWIVMILGPFVCGTMYQKSMPWGLALPL